MKSLYSFVLSFSLVLFFLVEREAFALKIQVFSEKNGKGLEADQKILAHLLESRGHSVSCYEIGENIDSPCQVDINIFFQVINPARCLSASANWFIPNPEWYCQDLEELKQIDLILCRTKEIERIFKGLNKETFFLGFTSQDCYRPHILKDFSSFFHLGGGSEQKGTAALMSVWSRNFFFPLLTVIKHCFCPYPDQDNVRWMAHFVGEEELREIQNRSGIHLCLSETEGFGHYLMEALSTGAVVVTTDAPPMNEFVTDPRCLVPAFRSRPQRLGINYYIHAGALEETINRLRRLPKDELEAIGRCNRENYLKKTEEFKQRLTTLLLRSSIYNINDCK